MRGFKAAEVLVVVSSGACVSAAIGVVVALAYAGLFPAGGDDDGNLEALVIAGAGALIMVPVVRAVLATVRLSRFRILMARRPEAYFEGHPYESRMLADGDLMRLAGRMAEMCRRYSTLSPSLMEFLLAYEELVKGYEPSSSWAAREIGRLEEQADRKLAKGKAR